MYRLGIDAGSKTVKVVLLDETGVIAHGLYRRHQSDIVSTLAAVLDETIWRFGDLRASVAFTGSAGIGIAEAAGIPFVQEVVATTRWVQSEYPQADAVIELGGEDAKIVYLTGGLEQRMNSSCAGGTGGFIDTIAFMLGVSTKDMSKLGMSAQHEYPIASRCAVFAQTDVRPLLNAGVRKADIAGSALQAVVRQTLTGLACGRPIQGTVVFAGGPFEHIPDLVDRFRRTLNLTRETGIKPENAHLVTAAGAALCSGLASADAEAGFATPMAEGERVTLALSELRGIVSGCRVENDLPRLPPLFADEEERAAFKARHKLRKVPAVKIFDCEGSLFLGVDAGSTAVKLAVVDEEGRLAYSDYRQARGDVLATTAKMLIDFYRALPSTVDGRPLCNLAHATATGYGEAILRAGLGFDSGVVETLAHVRAALSIEPQLSFLLDIGGQDMKALWVNEGMVKDAVLNEACSSGCGSYLEGSAHALKLSLEDFTELALEAKSPLDLGAKCTVFMSSRVRHAQKVGASQADIAAGIAYSVARSALFKTIGPDGVSKTGAKVVVQGGAFASDAVLRAFEQLAGVSAIRTDQPRLAGAIGAALVAKERSMKDGVLARTGLLSLAELKAFSYTRSACTCGLCSNGCVLSVVDFGSGGRYVTGNRCSRPSHLLGGNLACANVSSGKRLAPDHPASTPPIKHFPIGSLETASLERRLASSKPPNVMALRQGLLGSYAKRFVGSGMRGKVKLGLVNTLHAYDKLPFWRTLFSELGFTVIVPEGESFANGAQQGGLQATPSEGVCYPAKISHAKINALVQAGATHVFMPRYERGARCPAACEYSFAVDSTLESAGLGEALAFVSPCLRESTTAHLGLSEDSKLSLIESLRAVCPDRLSKGELDSALERASREQAAYVETVARGNDRALAWMRANGRRGMLVQGRPYHVDPAISHSIDALIQDLGLAVLSSSSLDWTTAAMEEPLLDLIILQSFGCSYDALEALRLREALEAKGKSPVVLKIDDVVDTAHIGIRLRTLVETVELRQNRADRRGAAEPFRLRPTRVGTSCDDRACANAARVFARTEPADVDAARARTKDICYLASVMMGRAVRIALSQDAPDPITVPYVCQKCVLDQLPDVVSRAAGRPVDVSWLRDSRALEDLYAPAMNLPQGGAGGHLKFGLVGSLPLVFDPYLNDGIVKFLMSQGCVVVFPDPALLLKDDVRYLEQFESFLDAGVLDVIYLQSFGCLKCHVHARGVYRDLKRRFPRLRVTFIDYDADASALNRENRLRLAVEQAKDWRLSIGQSMTRSDL